MTLKMETAAHIKEMIDMLESQQRSINMTYKSMQTSVPTRAFKLAELACLEEGDGLDRGDCTEMRYFAKLGFSAVEGTGYAANDINKLIGQLKAFAKKHFIQLEDK